MLYDPNRDRTPLHRKKPTKHQIALREAAIDPTRIAMKFDPREKRMKGIARHGDTPFDVPFISEIAPNLWQGGCKNGLILPDFIDHVVSLYPWEAYATQRELLTNLQITMFDSEEQTFEQIDTIARWINEQRQTGVVLVHCQAGLNRSSLVACRALMLEGMTATQAIATIRKKRSPACLCNKAFERHLLQL